MDDLREVVHRHDKDIDRLVVSVDNLVHTQGETNKRLEDISKHLANSAIASNKLEQMEREIADSFKHRDRERNESFKRFGEKLEAIEHIQRSDSGCQSVKLLTKDVNSMSKEHLLVMGTLEEHRIKLEHIDHHFTTMISPLTMKWVAGFIIMYSITFGSYVVNSINKLNNTDVKVTQMLTRDIKDTARLTKLIYEKHTGV